jgi:hypothetical protein
MQILTVTIVGFLLFPDAHANDRPTNSSLEWIRNKWTIETIGFTRWSNVSDSIASLSVSFRLYYHKWGLCNPSALPATGSSLPPDPQLCGFDLETSKYSALCKSSTTFRIQNFETPTGPPVWFPCAPRSVFRSNESESCKGLTYYQKIVGTRGCKLYDSWWIENELERPWVKWRVSAFDEAPIPTINIKDDSANFFRSITFELVNGQKSVIKEMICEKCSYNFQILSWW